MEAWGRFVLARRRFFSKKSGVPLDFSGEKEYNDTVKNMQRRRWRQVARRVVDREHGRVESVQRMAWE
jgi:hypothetical protein